MRDGAGRRVGRRGHGGDPPTHHVRRGGHRRRARPFGLREAGAPHAQAVPGRPAFRPVRRGAGGRSREAGPQRREAVRADQSQLDKFPEGVRQIVGLDPPWHGDVEVVLREGGHLPEQLGEVETAAAAQHGEHRLLQSGERGWVGLRGELRGVVGGQQHDPRVAGTGGARAQNEHLPGGGQLVEQARGVVTDAGRQDEGFPGTRGQADTGELFDDRVHAVRTAQHRVTTDAGDLVPVGEETREGRTADGLCLGTGERQ